MMKDEELVAIDRHDDCAMMTIRATMRRMTDDAEHRSNSPTLSQWFMLLMDESWDGTGCASLRVCGAWMSAVG